MHQPLLYFTFFKGLVAMWCCQTACCGEDGALTVALDRAAFEYEIQAVDIFTLHVTCLMHSAVDGIIVGSGEFLSPSVETVVEQTMVPLVVGERDKAMIASPCVVSGTDEAQHVSGSVLRCYDDEAFTLGNYDHNVVFANVVNMPSMRHLLTLDVPLSRRSRTALRVGYVGELMQSTFNHIKYHSYSHCLMIGFTQSFRKL